MSQDRHQALISILGSNLAGGGALACVSLARALRSHYRVEIVGPVFGASMWHGLDAGEIDVKAFPGGNFPSFLRTLQLVRRSINGDLVIAYGIRLPSLGLGLVHRIRTGTPCVLYVDEDDLALTRPGRDRPLHRRLASPNGDIHTRLVNRYRARADAVFCGSRVFAERFGGVFCPLGRDSSIFDPGLYNRCDIRASFGFSDREIVIGFMGNPRPHVGTEDLIAALEQLNDGRYTLLVAPTGFANDYTRELIARKRIRIRLMENEPSSRVPELLAASDLVAVPQRKEEMSLGQTPARLVEAMAMGKPIIATRLANIPDLLEGAGLVVADRSPDEIADALQWLDQHPVEAAALGAAARRRFLGELSLAAMAATLRPEIDRLLRSRGIR